MFYTIYSGTKTQIQNIRYFAHTDYYERKLTSRLKQIEK